MLASVLLTLGIIAAGTLASYLYEDDAPLVSRLSIGAVSGLAVAALFAFIVAHIVGLGAAALTGAAALVVLAVLMLSGVAGIRVRLEADAAALRHALVGAVRRPSLGTTGPVVYALGVATLVALAFERVIVVEADGISTGYVNNLGDLPFHMHLSASFAFSANLPPMNPTYAGSGLAYPYMADFLTATFLALGAPLESAFFVLNVTLGLSLVGIVHWFTRLLTRDALAALIAPALVLLSGGLGWLVMLDQLRASEQGVVAFLGALPQDYTIGGDPAYRWGNSITTLLATQRSLLFGLPVSVLVFGLLWRLVHAPPMNTVRKSVASVTAALRSRPGALAAGLLTGLLPLIHAHSFIVVMGTAFLLGLLFRQWREGRWRPWAIYVVAALAIALPEVWWSARNSLADPGTFFGLETGWDRGALDPVTFWLLNTGLFIPLVVVGLAVPGIRRRMPAGLVLFGLPFLVWFVVPNVVKLAPWVWDNIKVLFYWYVGFVPLVALLIAWLLRDRLLLRVAGIGVLASLVLAGSLDVWRVISRQTLYQEFDRDGIALASEILELTPQRTLILHAPTWNTPAYLTGRQSVMGYTGHMWAHGLDYVDREADIRQIYAGAPEAADLLRRYGVEYAVVSPLERAYGPVNQEFFEQYTEVAAAGEYRLYQIEP